MVFKMRLIISIWAVDTDMYCLILVAYSDFVSIYIAIAGNDNSNFKAHEFIPMNEPLPSMF